MKPRKKYGILFITLLLVIVGIYRRISVYVSGETRQIDLVHDNSKLFNIRKDENEKREWRNQSVGYRNDAIVGTNNRTTRSVNERVVDRATSQISLYSPAKLNTFLKVLRVPQMSVTVTDNQKAYSGKWSTNDKNESLHMIVGGFHSVSLFDIITIRMVSDGNVISCDDKSPSKVSYHGNGTPVCRKEENDVIHILEDHVGIPDNFLKGNLIFRAVALFRDIHCKLIGCLANGFEFSIVKRIPLEAGLGGGSSNAATVLYGLRFLTGNYISMDVLAEHSQVLGSDVPFFLKSQGAAVCSGDGTTVIPSKTEDVIMNAFHVNGNVEIQKTNNIIVIVKPPFGMSTSKVYRLFHQSVTDSTSNENLNSLPVETRYLNDLLLPVCQINPEIIQIIKSSEQILGIRRVSLSGSGSSVFGYIDPTEYTMEGHGINDITGSCITTLKGWKDKEFRMNTQWPGIRIFCVKFVHREHGEWYSP